VALVARALGVPRSSVSLVGGHANRSKRVAVTGVRPDDVGNALPR